MVRVANIASLSGQMQRCGVRLLYRFATEFWDIYRFPAGLYRNTVIRFNHLWPASCW